MVESWHVEKLRIFRLLARKLVN
uniref:Uncharacterized protein n=1 Tax=Anguilla anguilla TaxID=7936 RepID=A0A0E9U5N3_ANGAN